jgi:hypothetical protein
MRKYERGDLVHVDWLDHLAFRQIEKINQVLPHSSARFLFVSSAVFGQIVLARQIGRVPRLQAPCPLR